MQDAVKYARRCDRQRYSVPGVFGGGLALALKQGGYDWGILAYAVGFGSSMIWFGSSSGVALSNMFPEARNVGRWLYHGWHVALAYVIGFFFM